MAVNKSEKQELLDKLNLLLKKQSTFQQEINQLQSRIIKLQVEEPSKVFPYREEPVKVETEKIDVPKEKKVHKLLEQAEQQKTPIKKEKSKSEISSELEKFIGENLISKIGIAVLIIGVGIGAKYAIDNNLISPLVRILLGYLVGFILNFFAIRLKRKYYNFSAVLASGAMAIHYFITYAAYTYYGLYPNSVAFGLMVLITVLTVWLALHYNRQVIAHFGLAGAYITPFLLADPDSSILVLFTYMLIINCGILFISTKKRWKHLNYVAFVATWVIYMSWFTSDRNDDNLLIALTFGSLFFAIFYSVFLSYKLILKEKLHADDIVFLMLNSVVFYSVGMIALEMSDVSNKFAGLFTLINAIIHGITAYIIYRTEQKDKTLFYITVGMVIAFFTFAIPIQFNTNVTAILWAIEAAVIFWYGSTYKIKIIEVTAYILTFMLLIVGATIWSSTTYSFNMDIIESIITPIFNIQFLASLIVLASFAFIFFNYNGVREKEKDTVSMDYIFNVFFPLICIAFVYFTFFTEINLHWNNLQVKTSYELNSSGEWIKQFGDLNQDVFRFKQLWLLNYSLLFVSALGFINFRWFKDVSLNVLILVLGGVLIIYFFAEGLVILTGLRKNFQNPSLIPNYDVSIFHLIIRYITYLFFGVFIYSFYRFILPIFKHALFKTIFEITLSIIIVWICSSELINILNLAGSAEVYRIGLSILWGIFSFLLVGYGIWRKNKYLRITAIGLFGVTLLKLFFYDLSNLTTMQKTIVFILVGALLLIVSFMYNKYRNVIFGND